MKKISVLIFIALTACTTSQKNTQTTTTTKPISVDGKMFASLFQQRAAEYKALCFQAYNIATLRLNEALQQTNTKPLAVVTDIDETMLDNSPYAVHQSLLNKDYDLVSWMEWTAKSSADTLAGAKTFFSYASSKNVEVFYITNREEKERAGTLKNLQLFGFPFADEAHLITKQTTSSKETRRQTVSATHEIVLFLGDNLSDFSNLFDKKTEAERLQNVQSNASLFGKKFIVLPNPSYGDWEGALYKYNYNLTSAQKDSVIKASLKTY
ncbi:MAG: 5'-nucleotidase, lipoprotein e(P4) family [Bacteroidetes bacterium]|nr:5'-nucleotidase, lipoprotein e(P4) family [Bacteroidota bacterium]MBS1592142.1 5'-nucleotidase, lipoprotein e(P4) family [Bacteroidota bacterium]